MDSRCQAGAADTEAVEHVRFQPPPSVNCGVGSEDRRAASLLAFERDLDSSESIASEHSSIYDAARASSGSDTGDYYDSLSRQTTADEQYGLSFTPFDQPIHTVTSSHSKWPLNTLATIIERKSTSTLRHSRSMSCLYESFSGEGLRLSKPSRSELNTSTFSNVQRRKALSFNDADGCHGTSELLGYDRYLASPGQPIYPPPTRSPTPPGLPSFGTQEALFCASRFAIQSPMPRPSGDSRRDSYDSTLSGSYSEALRRLFGFSSPMEPRPPRLPLHAIARAEDGTAVRGRFPIRQSGHGMDLSRPLDSHPFHRITLPVAQPQVERFHPAGKRRNPGRHTSNSDVRTSSQGSGTLTSNLPSTLQRALTATMRRTDSTTTVGALPSLPSTQASNSQSSGPQKNPRVHVTSCTQDTSEFQDSNRPVSYQPTSSPSSSNTSPADDSPDVDGTEGHRMLAYSELLRLYILAFCCCSTEEEEDDAVRLDPQQNPSVPTGNETRTVSLEAASPTSDSAPSRHPATGECSNEQIMGRSSRPWRPAYGFSQTTDATMSTVG